MDSAKKLSALTAAEATKLCDDTYAYFERSAPQATRCKWKGLTFAASSSAPSQAILQQNCNTQQEACLHPEPGAMNSGCNEIPKDGCMATVAQYSACVSDRMAAFLKTVASLPECSMLAPTDTPNVFEAQGGGTPPATCDALDISCPGLSPPDPLNP